MAGGAGLGRGRRGVGGIEEGGDGRGNRRSEALDTLAGELRGSLEAIQPSVQLLHQVEEPYGPGQVTGNVTARG